MFIKLAFSTSPRITIPLRILADIINTPSITSVSALQSRFTSAAYDASLSFYFDAANSQIIRTVDPTNTKAHVAHWGTGANGDMIFTLEQTVYDSPSNKVYTQLCTDYVTATASSNTWHHRVGTSISGTMASSQTPLTSSDNTSLTTQGTRLTLGGNPFAMSTSSYAYGVGSPSPVVFWAYVTDKCFFWTMTNGPVNTGWPASYNNIATFHGVNFQTQYTRYDYHNNMGNGITPVLYTNGRAPSGTGGYGNSGDISGVTNYLFAGNIYSNPLRVHSLINAIPNTTSSWPLIQNQFVNMTMNGVSNQWIGHSSAQVISNSASATTPTYAGAYTQTTAARYTNNNITATGFGIMPFGWECNYYCNHGGNASDQNGVYLFNGEYAPGDTFTMGGTQYMLWPMFAGYNIRLAFAVPMV